MQEIREQLELIVAALVRRNELMNELMVEQKKMTELAAQLAAPRREPGPTDVELRRDALRAAIDLCNSARIHLDGTGGGPFVGALEDVREDMLDELRRL